MAPVPLKFYFTTPSFLPRVILHLACVSFISDCCQVNYLVRLILHATYAMCDIAYSIHEFLFQIAVKFIVLVDTACHL
jgi:hypothetical protein